MSDIVEADFVARAVAEGLTDLPMPTNPSFRALRARLVRAKMGEIVMSFRLGKAFLQGRGFVHGGALSTLLDTGMAMAVYSALSPDQATATASLTINFFAAAPPGVYWAHASVEKKGRSLAFTRATLYSRDEKTIAVATASFAILRRTD
jgi:uncharacterized protein (TIGR00369 family)